MNRTDQDLLDAANAIPLWQVLQELKVDAPPGDATTKSWKTNCPFGHEHMDHGLDRSLRVYYETNTACCFSMHGFLNPVLIWRRIHGSSTLDAARDLCTIWMVPVAHSWHDRLIRITEMEAAAPEASADDILTAALMTALGRHPIFEQAQYDTRFSAKLMDCFTRRELFPGNNLRRWFDDSKETLLALLDSIQQELLTHADQPQTD